MVMSTTLFFEFLCHHISPLLLVNIHAAEHLDKARIVMVHDLAVTQVFGRDLGHFLISQGEVPDVDVLLHPLHMDGLGDDGHVPLGTPAEGHLGRDLAVLFAGLGQLRVGEDAMLALRQRPTPETPRRMPSYCRCPSAERRRGAVPPNPQQG